jgi:hypothetical protein
MVVAARQQHRPGQSAVVWNRVYRSPLLASRPKVIDLAAPLIDVVSAVNAAQAAQRFVDVILDCEQ